MATRIRLTTYAALLCLALPVCLHAVENDGIQLYGSLLFLARGDFGADGAGGVSSTLGCSTVLSLEIDARPEEGLRLYARLRPSLATGNADPETPAPARFGGGAPQIIDRLWARFSSGILDIGFGRTPIAWGTAEIFRPCSRAGLEPLFDPIGGGASGTLGALIDITPWPGAAVGAYAAFEDRFHRADPLDLGWDTLPFGARLRMLAGPLEASLGGGRQAGYSSVRELLEASYFAAADVSLSLDPVRIYGEAALVPADFTALHPDLLEACAGIECAVPWIDCTARVEACHIGSGESDPLLYATDELLSGERHLLGKTYVYAGIEMLLIGGLGVLVNCGDASLAVIADAKLPVLDELWLGAGARIFLGPAGSEFGGAMGYAPRSSVYVSATVGF